MSETPDNTVIWMGGVQKVSCRVTITTQDILVEQQGVTDGGITVWVPAEDDLIEPAIEAALASLQTDELPAESAVKN